MNKHKHNIILIFFCLLTSFSATSQNYPEINDSPEEYIEHISTTWALEKNKVVYISNEDNMLNLMNNFHNSVFVFVKDNLSTSADIINEKDKPEADVCGLSLGNLDVKHINESLKDGKDYTQIKFKRMVDGTDYQFSDQLTSVLVYSKKLDFYIKDYITILTQLYKENNVDYVLICMDNEVLAKIPDALQTE